MLEIISSFPKQIFESFGYTYPTVKPYNDIVICGMGGSAIAGHLLKNLSFIYPINVEVVSSYGLPYYKKKEAIYFVISYSGNTEETLSAFEEIVKFSDNVVAITTGGKLAELSKKYGVPYISLPKGLPPRGALGYMLSTILLTLERNGILENIRFELESAINTLNYAVSEFSKPNSIAFELANKLYRRIPIIYAPFEMYAVAYRWQTQINENAKSFAHYHVLPEMNHNEISGLLHPKEIVGRSWIVFLTYSKMHRRLEDRIRITYDILKESVMGMDVVKAEGSTFLDELLYLTILGDFVSYYLSVFYNEDPVKIPRIDVLKGRLS